MSFNLPVEDALLFRNVFNDFDKNSDGLLSRSEFHNVFKQSGKEYTDKQINLYFRSVEPKSVGFIDFNGFLNLLYVGEKCLQPLTIAKNLFKEFDLDDSGSIGFDEFKIMMKDIYQEDSEKVDETILREFHKVDQDHSGQLSVNELAKVLEGHCVE